ncbi:glycosyltransferase family 2 protein [Planktothrix sp. FACHB-1355]|uniref:Glycosyltransferase family 2 protein n=1 Tax=Aerosakkonema funiforme FACHB-1375 TaxID=2949571 RepID=A0A926VLF9_9CYAN|nr:MULTISPECIES: glycosyltransferase family A protein [Oscillatoriales]MBD2184962.1 glycosyltransferase family 2 protein [Aerosakkonema funiforme FACHB-1375]MBD3559003.1 glycosyltransferase family 2 protein [Planktothrix sp. FACHB-1355]
MRLSLITATHNRVEKLANIAYPSVLGQTSRNFEWVIINDGPDLATRNFVAQIKADLAIAYLEMEHRSEGFSLCHARNLGLDRAKGFLVAYLDDDNALLPQFVESTIRFFQVNPQIICSMVRQHRRRDVVRNSQIVRQGKVFIAPPPSANSESLLVQKHIFDSNGFSHHLDNAPRWNPNTRVFADYEYFLQCLSRWGQESFLLNPLVLVNYVQTSEGTIGKSTYQEWASDLKKIYEYREQYSVLSDWDVKSWLPLLISTYEDKYKNGMNVPGFSES